MKRPPRSKQNQVRDKSPAKVTLPHGISRSEWLLVAVSLLCDINSWGHRFVLDDLPFVVSNSAIHSASRLLEIFSSPFGVPALGLYRPLTTLTLALNEWIGGPHPDGFHLINRLLHVLICLGIFWTVRRLIPKPSSAALFTGLIFAVHPIQTEAITYITGRSDALAMFFFVFAWFYFVRVRLSAPSRIQFPLASLLLYFLGLLSKENVITWLGVALLTELVYFSRGKFKDFVHQLGRGLWRVYAGYLLVTIIYLAARFAVLRGMTRMETGFLVNPLAYASFGVRLLTALKIFFQNIALCFFPFNLSADYSYNQIPLVTPWSSPAGVGAALLAVGFAALLVWSYKHTLTLFFGLGFFAVTYSVVSNLLLPIGTIRADRLLYLPVLGLCLPVGVGLAWIRESNQREFIKRAMPVVLVTMLLLLGFRTVSRNRDWRDQFAICSQTVRTSPQSAKMHNSLGYEYYSRNELDKALEQYRIAEVIYPDFSEALNNMGVLLLKQGKTEEAIPYFHRSITLSPNKAYLALNNLGNALRNQGDFNGAIEQYDLGIRQNPSSAVTHFNKGEALHAMGRINEAVSEYSRALEIDPQLTVARIRLGQILQGTKPPPSK